MTSSAIVLRCTECGLPWAKVVNGVLMVESRHHGEKHLSVIAIAELVKLEGASNVSPRGFDRGTTEREGVIVPTGERGGE